MDTSFWTNINPKIEIVPTTKKYYNQYLYKLVVRAPGGRSIETNGSISDHIENRKVWDRQINQFGWWGRNNKELELADTEFLNIIRDIKNNSSIKLKVRIEEPYRYKIMIRDGRIPLETKNSILNYLNGLGPEHVRIPRNLQQTLENNKHGYIWGCYFYANELSDITFLSLIAPELISNIHELVVLTNK